MSQPPSQPRDLGWWLKVAVALLTLAACPVGAYLAVSNALAARPTWQELRQELTPIRQQLDELRSRGYQQASDLAVLRSIVERLDRPGP